MQIIQSAILGLTQGLTEFLPISSSGHLIVIRSLFHYSLDNTLAFDVFLNTATLLAVIYCFWGEINRLLEDFFTEGFSSRSINLIYALIIGTIPAALIGFLYGNKIENAFRSPIIVALALIFGSLLMAIGDFANKKFQNHGGVNPLKGFVIGLFQTLALIPGVSRSGATISGGLISKLSREEAIRFSFLLYIPISIGALLKIVLDLGKSGLSNFINFPHIVGFLMALFSGIFAIRFMIRFLSRHSFNVFIAYRVILAILILLFLR